MPRYAAGRDYAVKYVLSLVAIAAVLRSAHITYQYVV